MAPACEQRHQRHEPLESARSEDSVVREGVDPGSLECLREKCEEQLGLSVLGEVYQVGLLDTDIDVVTTD